MRQPAQGVPFYPQQTSQGQQSRGMQPPPLFQTHSGPYSGHQGPADQYQQGLVPTHPTSIHPVPDNSTLNQHRATPDIYDQMSAVVSCFLLNLTSLRSLFVFLWRVDDVPLHAAFWITLKFWNFVSKEIRKKRLVSMSRTTGPMAWVGLMHHSNLFTVAVIVFVTSHVSNRKMCKPFVTRLLRDPPPCWIVRLFRAMVLSVSNPVPSQWGGLWAYPQTKLQAPQIVEIWNTRNQWSFIKFSECQAPPAQSHCPPLEIFWRRFRFQSFFVLVAVATLVFKSYK